jgi:hypothetical protein
MLQCFLLSTVLGMGQLPPPLPTAPTFAQPPHLDPQPPADVPPAPLLAPAAVLGSDAPVAPPPLLDPDAPAEPIPLSPHTTPPPPAPRTFLALQQPADKKTPDDAKLSDEQPLIHFHAAPKESPSAKPAADEVAAADRWLLMRALQGTWLGSCLDCGRFSVSGWLTPSINFADAAFSNQPLVWTDRSNRFLLQQCWVRFDRAIVSSGTTEPTWGFRSDWQIGSDYRFSIMRGLWNEQLLNSQAPDGDPEIQNIYGVDPIQFYVNAYFPTWFQGTEIRVGRCYCPFGVESLEAVSTPLMTRSYAFNWSPPFTHMAIMATINLSPQWQIMPMLINGNDVWLDPAQEARFAGKITWTSPSKNDVIAFGTSIGRGKFNRGEPFDPQTISLPDEPNGRNNINVFDLTWTHVFGPKVSYVFECIYGYQYGVPTVEEALATTGRTTGAIIQGGLGTGTAHWGSICQYLFLTCTPTVGAVIRFELFDDFEGQRTGYEGLYTAITCGVQFKPRKGLWIRPEIRYDYNGYSRPFDPDNANVGRSHGLLFAGADLIFRW